MLFKKLIILGLVTLALGAREVELVPLKGKSLPGLYADGSMDVLVRYHDDQFDDWIAVYKEGASNEWENVIAWKWVRDLSDGYACPTSACDNSYPRFLRVDLEDGDYEVRFFKNNSYVVDKKLDFTVKAVNSFVTGISQSYEPYRNEVDIEILGTSDSARAGDKDWVGLYKVDDSNAWNNVKKWAWVANDLYNTGKDTWSLEGLGLASGNYELRYFLKNSFNTHKKSATFYYDENRERPILEHVVRKINLPYFSYVKFKNVSGNPKDWYGVFKEGAERNSHNLRAWGYNSAGETEGSIKLKEESHGRYDLVWFENDTYNALATSKLIIMREF